MDLELIKRILSNYSNNIGMDTRKEIIAYCVKLESDKLEAERLLQDYQDLIKCDYGKNHMAINNKGLYMHDLADALGGNAAKECERIYLETEKYFEKDKG